MGNRTQPGQTPERVQPDRIDPDRRYEGDVPVPDKNREQSGDERTQPQGGERQQPR
jgi:hypothetical protein